jgi:hypothetical protein
MRQNLTRNKSTRNKATSKPAGQAQGRPPELVKALEHVGLFSRVAKRGGWSLGHVLQVAKGKHQSQLVINAVIAEVRRIERQSENAA